MMTIQYIITAIVLATCVAYAIWRIRKTLSVKTGDPCYGCALKKVCKKKGTRNKNKSL